MADSVSRGPVWGFIEQIGGDNSEKFYFHEREVTIGRSEDNVIIVPVTRVSRHHCKLHYDAPGNIHIHDSSQNGTIINKTIRIRNKEVLLKTGDEILLAEGNAETGIAPVAFKITFVRHFEEISIAQPGTEEIRPAAGPASSPAPVAISPPPSQPEPKRIKREANPSDDDDEILVDDILVRPKPRRRLRAAASSSSRSVEPDVIVIDDESTDDDEVISLGRPMKRMNRNHKNRRKGGVDQEVPTGKKSKVEEPAATPAPPEEKSAVSSPPQEKSGEQNEEAVSALNSIADTVACAICMEMLHDPVTSGVCLHSFCGGCLSQWIFGDGGPPRQQCPKCRATISTVSRNSGLASVVADVLRVKQKERRPDSELEELDKHNKFTGHKVSFDILTMYREMVGAARGRGATRGGARGRRSRGSAVAARGRASAIAVRGRGGRTPRGRRSALWVLPDGPGVSNVLDVFYYP